MKKFKRIFSLLCVAILVGLYLCTLIFAFTDNSATMDLFWASVICTVIFPVTLYAYTLFYKVINRKDNDKDM